MKKLHFIALSISCLISQSSFANEFPICNSDLIKDMKRFEKTSFAVPRKVPTGQLRELAIKMEILCPWQVEADINGDRQLDWVGIIQRNKKFELVAYISASPKYKLQLLHSYQFFPEQSYLKAKKQNNKLKKNKKSINDIYAVTLNDNSQIYSWVKGELKVIGSYVDETSIQKKRSQTDLEIPRKRKKPQQ